MKIKIEAVTEYGVMGKLSLEVQQIKEKDGTEWFCFFTDKPFSVDEGIVSFQNDIDIETIQICNILDKKEYEEKLAKLKLAIEKGLEFEIKNFKLDCHPKNSKRVWFKSDSKICTTLSEHRLDFVPENKEAKVEKNETIFFNLI